ncbi:MAG: hypothetical protein RL291_141 [Pseudomonadota bacterium]|jgi:tRNA-Thr(GGU) m(6)t(6)A37 methyltransferase TsaA
MVAIVDAPERGLALSNNSDSIRPGEVTLDAHARRDDASVQFIGRIKTPFATRADCPRQGDVDAGPICRLEIEPVWQPALQGLEEYEWVEVIYWLHQARRDMILQSPKANGITRGTFALRSPLRPNPIGTSLCRLVGIENGVVLVRGLDCLDNTPLIDLKPDRCSYSPLAPHKAPARA